MELFDREKMITLKGRGIGNGRSAGYLRYVTEDNGLFMPVREKGDTRAELETYESARRAVKDDLLVFKEEFGAEFGGECSHVFVTQMLLLDDVIFTDLPRMYIKEGRIAEEAVCIAKDYFFNSLCKTKYGKELLHLSIDISDVADRILGKLRGRDGVSEEPTEPCILITPSPAPSQIIAWRKQLLGVVGGMGLELSSSALITRALGIPALSINEEIFSTDEHRYAIIDADEGALYINPDLSELERSCAMAIRSAEQEKLQTDVAKRECMTRGNTKVGLYLSLPRDSIESGEQNVTSHLGTNGLRGVICTATREVTDEDSLFEEYRSICEQLSGRTLIIRSECGSGVVGLSSGSGEGELYVVRNESLRLHLCAAMRAAVYAPVCFAISVGDDADDIFRFGLLQKELRLELSTLGREFSSVKIGAVIDTPGAAVFCESIIDASDIVCVDREKLDAMLFDSGSANCGRARRMLLERISRICKHKGRRAMLVLGEKEDTDDVSEALELGFSSICASSERLCQVKSQIIEHK